MDNDHDMIPVVGWGSMFYCSKCGAQPETYSYIQPCPVADEVTKKHDPIGDAVRESSIVAWVGFIRINK